jgi:hypothetical protein
MRHRALAIAREMTLARHLDRLEAIFVRAEKTAAASRRAGVQAC